MLKTRPCQFQGSDSATATGITSHLCTYESPPIMTYVLIVMTQIVSFTDGAKLLFTMLYSAASTSPLYYCCPSSISSRPVRTLFCLIHNTALSRAETALPAFPLIIYVPSQTNPAVACTMNTKLNPSKHVLVRTRTAYISSRHSTFTNQTRSPSYIVHKPAWKLTASRSTNLPQISPESNPQASSLTSRHETPLKICWGSGVRNVIRVHPSSCASLNLVQASLLYCTACIWYPLSSG